MHGYLGQKSETFFRPPPFDIPAKTTDRVDRIPNAFSSFLKGSALEHFHDVWPIIEHHAGPTPQANVRFYFNQRLADPMILKVSNG